MVATRGPLDGHESDGGMYAPYRVLPFYWTHFAAGNMREKIEFDSGRVLVVDLAGQKAKSTVMVARNPAFRQKAPGIRGGVWGEAPRFFFIFFL